jgi:heme/copper-type cytochrome/quinol oxidase subunit 2
MEGFILNIIATVGFSGIFLLVFFLVYYLYLRGNEGKVREDGKVKDKNKRLRKRILK